MFTPIRYSLKDDVDSEPPSQSDIVLSRLQAKETAVRFHANSNTFLNVCDLLEIVKQRIPLSIFDLENMEEFPLNDDIFQTDFHIEVETFRHHVSLCMKLSETQRSARMTHKLEVLIEFGDSLQIRTAKSLLNYYSLVSHQTQDEIVNRMGNQLNRILIISGNEKVSLPEDLKRDIHKKLLY